MKIVGLQNVDFTPEGKAPVKGLKLHVADYGYINNGFGASVGTIWVDEKNPVYIDVINTVVCPGEYDLRFGPRGNLIGVK